MLEIHPRRYKKPPIFFSLKSFKECILVWQIMNPTWRNYRLSDLENKLTILSVYLVQSNVQVNVILNNPTNVRISKEKQHLAGIRWLERFVNCEMKKGSNMSRYKYISCDTLLSKDKRPYNFVDHEFSANFYFWWIPLIVNQFMRILFAPYSTSISINFSTDMTNCFITKANA